MRLTLKTAGLLALAVAAVTCSDAPTGPGAERGGSVARLAMAPSFSTSAARAVGTLESMGIVVTKARVTLTAADGTTQQTALAFPADQDTLTMELTVRIQGTAQTFTALIELLDDAGVVLFAQTQLVTARAASLPAAPSPTIVLDYVGPGFKARTISVSPIDAVLEGIVPLTLTATAADATGAPVPDLLVSWRSADTTIATLVATGTVATVRGTGRRGVVTITATGPTGTMGQAKLTMPPQAVRLAPISGDAQVDSVGRALATPLVVKVTDDFGVPVAGAAVSWTRVAGVGKLGAASSISDADGLARVGYTLGTTLGTDTVRASLTGAAGSATFSMRAISLSASAITAVSGSAQSAVVLGALPNAFVARVSDSFGNPVKDASVQWSAAVPGSITLAPALSVSDAEGRVTTTATLGQTAGVVTVTAIVGSARAVFDATALPGPASTLALVQAPTVSATNGASLAPASIVQVVDAFGNAVSGVPVTVSLVGSGATLVGPALGTTGADGRATFDDLSILGAIGQYRLQFTSETLAPASSGMISLAAGAPASVGLAQPWPDPKATPAGSPIAVQPVLQLYDVSGNPAPVSGVTVSAAFVTTPDPKALLGGTTSAITDATGQARFTDLGIGGLAGAYTLQFAATTYKSATSGSVTVAAGTPTQMLMVTQPPASILAGLLTPAPAVRVTDAFGNGIAGIPVTVAGTGLLAPALTGTLSVTTDANGVATFDRLSLTGTLLSGTLVFTTATPALSLTSQAISLL